MPVKALKATVHSLNGMGSFILPCKKIAITYCNTGGSSQGVRDYIRSKKFTNFARANQNIVISVLEKPGRHPVVKGYYTNGKDKPICVKNMDMNVVDQKMTLLRESSGQTLGWYKQSVHSVNESARGIWSPLHVGAHKV